MSRNLAAQKRSALERKHRGALNAHVGFQSIIIDIGASMTKVMVASDQHPRAVILTPAPVAKAMKSAIAAQDVEEVVVHFVYRVCSQANVPHTQHTVIVLFNAVHNKVFEKLVVDTIAANTPHQRVRPMCTQVAALLAHNTNSGIVVDAGYHSCVALPVVQDIGSQFDAVSSTRGLAFIVEKLRQQILHDNPVFLKNQFHPTAHLPDAVLLNFLMQYGTIAPPVSDDTLKVGDKAIPASSSRAAMLHAEYPLTVKTIIVYGKPNLALEHFFSRVPERSSPTDSAAATKVVYDDAEEEAPAAEKTMQHIFLAALMRCDPLTLLKDACTSVVLVGGITQLPNFNARFAFEALRALKGCTDPERGESMRKVAGLIQMPSLPSGVSPTVAAVVGAAAIASSK